MNDVAFFHLRQLYRMDYYCLTLQPLNKLMKTLFFVLLSVLIFSCSSKKEEENHQAENALDAGREFIQNSLQGKFNTANKYMLQDEENQYWLSKWTKDFNTISEQEKAAYNKASINISEVSDVKADSITVIKFNNSYRKVPQVIKVVKYKGEWLVDFKYTFSGNL